MEWGGGGQEALVEAGEGVHGRRSGEIGEREGVVCSLRRFGFPSWSVLVLWVIVHVFSSDSFGFINKRTFLKVR